MTGAVSLPLVFLAGVISFASPCFLPVVPVFITYLTGSGPSEANPLFASMPAKGMLGAGGVMVSTRGTQTLQRETTRARGIANAAAFVAAFSTVFILLWVMIATVGWAVGDYRDLLRIVGGSVLIVLGLVTGGLLNFQWLAKTQRSPLLTQGAPTLGRSALMGFGFGAGWSPCIGPVLGVVLGMAVSAGSIGMGTALLVVYCLGLGLPFILVAAGAASITKRLSWFSRHYGTVQKVSAVLLIALGLLLVADLLAPLSSLTWVSV